MRFFLLGLLLCAPVANAYHITVCYNYGCAVQAQITLDDRDLVQLNVLFGEVEDAESEREAIRQAVGYLSQVAGAQTPIHNDRARNDNEEDVDGRMDCIDHSRTTTAYLQFMQRHGLLQYHRVLEPIHRAPLLVNDHWGARIEEIANGAQYVVDPWFFDFGALPAIFPRQQWLSGAFPHE